MTFPRDLQVATSDPQQGLLLFLGAGASAPPPTCLPDFALLMRESLSNLGWRQGHTPQGKDQWEKPPFPPISPPWISGVPPEVVFRVMQDHDVNFAGPIETAFAEVSPNAVHKVAAALLASGGDVWTTNFDCAIEREWSALTTLQVDRMHRTIRVRAGTTAINGQNLQGPPFGHLVKFHGSADVPGSLAVSDRELLSPLVPEQISALAQMAAGKHLVFYGYRAMDADLYDLLVASISRAARATFLVVESAQTSSIQRALPTVTSAEYLPYDIGPEFTQNVPKVAKTFHKIAKDHGLAEAATAEDWRALATVCARRHTPDLSGLKAHTALVDLDLVDRFANQKPSVQKEAIKLALREDLRRPLQINPKYLRMYAHRLARWSLYNKGVVAKLYRATGSALRRSGLARRALVGPGVRRFTEDVLTKEPALLLGDGRWQEILLTTQFATNGGRRGGASGSDLLYQGHALRQFGDIHEARRRQDRARPLLEGQGNVDAERLAGTLLELGILDTNQGLFEDALKQSDDLIDVRGRYAIQRWEAWGQWLRSGALMFQLELDTAEAALDKSDRAFTSADDQRQKVDILIMREFMRRLRSAVNRDTAPVYAPGPVPDRGTARQHQDLALIHADMAVASGQLDEARSLIDGVLHAPATGTCRMWAKLVLAELERQTGRRSHAHDAFEELLAETRDFGVYWLALQCAAGLIRCGDSTGRERWWGLAQNMQIRNPDLHLELTCDARPLLWAVT